MTKAATIESHRFLCLVVLAAMVITMIPVAMAVLPGGVLAGDNSTESSHVSGDFTVNQGNPVVNSVTLHSHGGGATTPMSPTTEYEMWVNVTHPNTLESLDTIELKLYYDSDGTYSDAEAQAATANNNSCAIITYTNLGTDTWVLSNSSTTWAVASGSEAPAGTEITGDFKFHFTVSKVARETTGAAEWHAYALATDSEAHTHYNHQEGLTMNWYGEITSVTDTVTFGSVVLGATQKASGNISASYISNGDYDEQVRTTSTWNGTTENLNLDDDGSPGDSAFSIEADDDANTGGAVFLAATVYRSIDASQGYTADVTGYVEATNTLWLTLGSTGIPAETYNGTVYFAIANR